MSPPTHPRRTFGVIALPAAVVLLCFTARRLLFALAAVSSPTAVSTNDARTMPTVTLLVPARNEARGSGATLAALAELDFPPERLTILLIDDCSDDATALVFETWSRERETAHVLRLAQPVGKYAALNEGIRLSPETTIVAVCDADVCPQRAWLRELVEPFADPRVGAVAGYLSPVNADISMFARYAAVESWVHQLVTSAGKDVLGLDPPTLGACAYRRVALDEVGWFGTSVSGEDVRISNALTRAGWRIRFAEAAIADNSVVHAWRDYWHQHLRWARNVFSSRPAGAAEVHDRPVSVRKRIESQLAAAGYADRVALLAVLVAVRARTLPRWLPCAYGTVAALEVVVAVVKAGRAPLLPRFVATTVGLFPVDVIASTAAAVAQILGRPRTWRQPRR